MAITYMVCEFPLRSCKLRSSTVTSTSASSNTVTSISQSSTSVTSRMPYVPGPLQWVPDAAVATPALAVPPDEELDGDALEEVAEADAEDECAAEESAAEAAAFK